MGPVKWRSADTDAGADSRQTEIYRQMTGADRVALAFRLNEQVRETAAAGIRSRHPDYSEERVRWAVQRLWLDDDELYRRVWPGRELVDP
jgi:hypothetical protein